MTIPLDRLRDFPLTTPAPGGLSVAVARHEAPTWPSPEVVAYAQERSRLIHELVDDTGIAVTSWGETDGQIPREVVEVLLTLAGPVLSALGVRLAGWITRSRKAKGKDGEGGTSSPAAAPTPLPGIALKRHNGDELRITYRDGLSHKEILSVVTAFLDGAVEEKPAET